jgi:hypothetical protein
MSPLTSLAYGPLTDASERLITSLGAILDLKNRKMSVSPTDGTTA